MMSSVLLFLFEEFQKIPKGVLIDRPDELVETGFSMNETIWHAIHEAGAGVFFTRRTLKHLAEKGSEGTILFSSIPHVLTYPDIVYRGNNVRILIAKLSGVEKEGEFYVVVIERTSSQAIIIITSFIAKEKYLKNFEILWRTAAS